MLCFLTARRLKPGSFADFRKAWEPVEWDPRFVRAYHVRNLNDENEVFSFGLFDGGPEDYRAMPRDREEARVARIGEFVEEVLVDGVYEVVDEVTPSRR
jgi:hypothetical protein